MSNLHSSKFPLGSATKRDDITIRDVIQIVIKRKNILIPSMIFFFAVAILYNIITKPIYQATVVLKKESSVDRTSQDKFNEMFQFQTMDEVDTELGLIKTRTVFMKVINELRLYFNLDEVKYANGVSRSFNCSLSEYERNLDSILPGSGKLPIFTDLQINLGFKGGEYYIEKSQEHLLQLINDSSGELIQSIMYADSGQFRLTDLSFNFSWKGANVGDVVYFEVENLEPTFKKLEENISITRRGKTNLFSISAKSNSPEMAQKIANTLSENFRDARLEQKRQTIHGSFSFVDDQLKEISDKLKDAEVDLSQFKSKNQIALMDESSRDILESLSGLESEKIKTDIELGEYQNKLNQIEMQVKDRGYFDQTYLAPTSSDVVRSPFSALLEQLSDAEIRRLELLQRRKATHPDVVTLDDQISKIKSKLGEYNQNTITSYKIIINTLKKKQIKLRNLINKYAGKIEKLPEQETRLIELVRSKTVYEKMFTLLLDKREELRMSEFSKLQDIIVVDYAHIPLKPIAPRKKLNMAVGLMLGVIMGLALTLVWEYFDKKFTSIDEFEKTYPFSVLAILPKYDKELTKKIKESEDAKGKLVTLMRDQIIFTDSYRALAVKLRKSLSNGKNTVLFTSSEENTGKTTIVSNFAISLARAGKKILILDCDLRKSKIADFYMIPPDHPGVIQFLSDNTYNLKFFKPFKEDLQIMPAGGTIERSAELLGSEKMEKLLDLYSPLYDYILIDTPPVTKVVDTLILGEYVKDVVFIIRPNHTFKAGITLATEELLQSNMNILGVVFNACHRSQMSLKYKYGYGYGYGNAQGYGAGYQYGSKDKVTP
jgi:capsular exopolysaccharide synthesis family protein